MLAEKLIHEKTREYQNARRAVKVFFLYIVISNKGN